MVDLQGKVVETALPYRVDGAVIPRCGEISDMMSPCQKEMVTTYGVTGIGGDAYKPHNTGNYNSPRLTQSIIDLVMGSLPHTYAMMVLPQDVVLAMGELDFNGKVVTEYCSFDLQG